MSVRTKRAWIPRPCRTLRFPYLVLYFALTQTPCALPTWSSELCWAEPSLRLRGGSQVHVLNGIRKRQRQPISFEQLITSEDAQALFKPEEIKDLEAKYTVEVQGCVPFHLVGDLRAALRKRRDKVSRAMLAGRDVSESEPEAPDPAKTGGRSQPPVVARRMKDAPAPASKRPSNGTGKDIQSEVRLAVERAAYKRRREEQSHAEETPPAAKTNFSSPDHVHMASKELLNYNPSLADGGQAEQASKEPKVAPAAERYICWMGVGMDGGSTPSDPQRYEGAKCQLIAVRSGVEVVSSDGFGLGMVKGREAPALLALLSAARLEAAFVSSGEAEGKRGGGWRVEVLVYGDGEVEGMARRVLNGTRAAVEWAAKDGGWGSTAQRSRGRWVGGREKERENMEVEELLSGGGGGLAVEDLFGAGVTHEAMPEMEAPAAVTTPLLVHQRKALHWMVTREQPSTPLFWERYHNKRTGRRGWFNTVTRVFSARAPASSRGGMLADDMGLGKTLSMLALIVHGMQQRRAKLLALAPSTLRRSREAAEAAGGAAGGRDKESVNVDEVEGPTLIVAPLSVVQTWADQIEQHTDRSPRVLLYHGPQRARLEAMALMLYDVVITTYSILGMEYIPEDKRDVDEPASMLHCLRWSRVVLDEGHLISNRNTLQSKAVIELNATTRWVVTGTPIQNKIEDLFPAFAFLRLHPLDSFPHFQRMVVEPMRNRDPSSLLRIRKLLQIFCLRRTKEQRLHGRPIVVLPGKEVILRQLRLGRREQAVYDALQARGRAIIGGMLAEAKGGLRYTQVLVLLLRLRQFCNHPSLILSADSAVHQRLSALRAWGGEAGGEGGGERGRWGSVEELVRAVVEAGEEIAGEAGEGLGMEEGVQVVLAVCEWMERGQASAVVESALVGVRQVVDWGRLAAALRKTPLPQGLIRASGEDGGGGGGGWSAEASMSDRRFLSTKVAAVLEELATIEAGGPGQKTVVFSQFSRFLDVLEGALQWRGTQFVRLDGSMPREARTWAVREFHERPEVPVLLVTLKSGGMGLNLVAANNVLLTDLWWNGAAEEQAMDRVHRVGQTRAVRVVRFVTRRTVEERVLRLQRRKQAMIRGAMQQKLTVDDVKRLFATFTE